MMKKEKNSSKIVRNTYLFKSRLTIQNFLCFSESKTKVYFKHFFDVELVHYVY